jgi:hypothetical protein
VVAALVLAVAIQFVPVERSNPPVETEVDAPKDVAALLRRSCYDCHSNETRWPWYSRVAPASWVVAWDVGRAREDMNFSEWPVFDFELQEDMLADVVKQLERGRMPLTSYVVMHPQANLRPAERARLIAWARGE